MSAHALALRAAIWFGLAVLLTWPVAATPSAVLIGHPDVDVWNHAWGYWYVATELGSLSIPEYIFPVLSVQFAGGFFTALGERQEAGELNPDELTFWNNVVVGSAEGGALLEDAAEAAGTGLPGSLAGSIDAVQRSALQDPFEENERRRAIAEAAAELEDCQALMLAQHTMGPARHLVKEVPGRQILTSPDAAALKLKRLVTEQT